jgi:hypothetical protein
MTKTEDRRVWVSELLSTASKALSYHLINRSANYGDTHHPPSEPVFISDLGNRQSGNGRSSTASPYSTSSLDNGLEKRKHSSSEASLRDPAQAACQAIPPGKICASPRALNARDRGRSCSDLQSAKPPYPPGITQSKSATSLRNTKETDTSTLSTHTTSSADDSVSTAERCSEIVLRPPSPGLTLEPSRKRGSGFPGALSVKPLRTCLKHKAKSAGATPSEETVLAPETSQQVQQLRRRKTVDFAKAIAESIPPSGETSSIASDHCRPNVGKATALSSSRPGMASLFRRSPASPAVTRTDVHVIAIAPSSSVSASLQSTQAKNLDLVDPVTPTMQVIESSDNRYEVVWDEFPPEHDARTERRSSSAGQALQDISTSTKCLERVNTKLTQWSGTWNPPSDSFKPTAVVFRDEDSRKAHSEIFTVDNEDSNLSGPPSSGSVSNRISQSPTREESSDSTDEHLSTSSDASSWPGKPHGALDLEAYSAYLIAARQSLNSGDSDQKLSNVEDANFHFRTHRDSMSLARTRLLIGSGGVRPELFAHRDSVEIAKKRMHARNCAVPGSAPPPEHYAAVVASSSSVKAHANDALRKDVPASI